MKKKILAIGLVVCMLVVAIGSATMAYFTDTEGATNVMVVGEIDIEQTETGADGGEFEDGQHLLPNVTIVKEVEVENVGRSEAYVRTLIAFEGTKEFVEGKLTVDGSIISANNYVGQITVNGEEYTLYMYVHAAALKKGDTVTGLLNSFTLKPEVTQGEVAFAGEEYNILVLTQAVQAQGVDDNAKDALDKAFGVITPDNHPWGTTMDWYGDGTADTFYLTTASDLRGFAEMVSTSNPRTFDGKTVVLAADIDLAGTEWTPIYSHFDPVPAITFDGNGYTISNMTVTGGKMLGFIGDNSADWTIKNLTFENAEVITSGSYAGVVFGYQYGAVTLDNVTVKDSVVKSTAKLGTCIGALVGYSVQNDSTAPNVSLTVDGCEVTGNEITGYHSIGTVVGCTKKTNASLNIKDTTITENTLYYKSSTLGAHEVGSGDSGYITVNYTDNGGNIIENNERIRLYASANDLQTAIDNAVNGDVIVLGGDITGDVTVTQQSDVKITIDGNGHTFAGVLTVDGKSSTYLTAGLTVKNVVFNADSISADACIRMGNGTNATRYVCNLTVENCTFDVPGAVGVKSYTGGDKNLTITGCTVTAACHSLVQAKGIDVVKVENCKVYSKNGLNFNNSTNVTVDGCEVDVKGYAVRFGEGSSNNGAAETYLIKNCALKSANDDGDATIVLRGTADKATLTIVNTTIAGTPDITNTATGATVVK